jgi:hypothetical protein
VGELGDLPVERGHPHHMHCGEHLVVRWIAFHALNEGGIQHSVDAVTDGLLFLFFLCLIHTALTAKYIMAPRAVPSPGNPLRIWHIGFLFFCFIHTAYNCSDYGI